MRQIDPNSTAGYTLESHFGIDLNRDSIIGQPLNTIWNRKKLYCLGWFCCHCRQPTFVHFNGRPGADSITVSSSKFLLNGLIWLQSWPSRLVWLMSLMVLFVIRNFLDGLPPLTLHNWCWSRFWTNLKFPNRLLWPSAGLATVLCFFSRSVRFLGRTALV